MKPPPPPKKHHRCRLPSKITGGRFCGTVDEHHLFCCDVSNLNRERSVESEERVSGERVGKAGEETVKKDGRQRRRERQIKWRERKGNRFVRACVCVCVMDMGGTNLREEMGALRVLSRPLSSSHSWEIWSTELGATSTQTQINCCLENLSSFPFIGLRVLSAPAEAQV